jgi:hypothetical protein
MPLRREPRPLKPALVEMSSVTVRITGQRRTDEERKDDGPAAAAAAVDTATGASIATASPRTADSSPHVVHRWRRPAAARPPQTFTAAVPAAAAAAFSPQRGLLGLPRLLPGRRVVEAAFDELPLRFELLDGAVDALRAAADVARHGRMRVVERTRRAAPTPFRAARRADAVAAAGGPRHGELRFLALRAAPHVVYRCGIAADAAAGARNDEKRRARGWRTGNEKEKEGGETTRQRQLGAKIKLAKTPATHARRVVWVWIRIQLGGRLGAPRSGRTHTRSSSAASARQPTLPLARNLFFFFWFSARVRNP